MMLKLDWQLAGRTDMHHQPRKRKQMKKKRKKKILMMLIMMRSVQSADFESHG